MDVVMRYADNFGFKFYSTAGGFRFKHETAPLSGYYPTIGGAVTAALKDVGVDMFVVNGSATDGVKADILHGGTRERCMQYIKSRIDGGNTYMDFMLMYPSGKLAPFVIPM